MLFEVRVKNPDGSIKEVISAQDLKKNHWENFRKSEESLSLQNSDRPKIPKWVKEALDLQFAEFSDSGYSDF